VNVPNLSDQNLVAGLNPAQRDAVTHPGGPLLVLAGAGSGKTRVITQRIAHLVTSRGVPASRIVAVTFTNKAAKEMRERVERQLGSRIYGAWIGTFHALCLRILRRHGERIGLKSGFNIYDTDDQRALVKRILKQEAGDDANHPPRSFLSRISRAKNAMESPASIDLRAFSPERKLLARVYTAYEEALRKSNAVDFDDLLLRSIELYRDCPEIADCDSERCEQLLVDEYQDTNRPQYLLVKILSQKHGNICVVGDEDQSIYRFRGAELRNILEFESDHPGARTIRLEQNYRSTGKILDAAGAVVANNISRKGKTLWTENPSGDAVQLFRAPDDRSEAIWISRRIRQLEREMALEDIAVLYRTNAQSRLLEEIFRRDQIAYSVLGAVQFYARKEIKDLLAYLKLAANPADDVSFRRIVSTPPRGIGATTLSTVDRIARTLGLSFLEASEHAVDQELVSARACKSLRAFLLLIEDLSVRGRDGSVAALLDHLVETVGYEAHLDRVYAGLGAERMENVRALVSAAAEYGDESDDASLHGFLDRSALVADSDEVGKRPGVTLMTIHCAKGLEFKAVFVAGLEENLFPHAMASGSDEDLEEERRLCYVAMTRARQRLMLTHAHFRRVQGAPTPNPPSRFLDEIPAELIEEVETPADLWDARDRQPSYGSYATHGSSAAMVAARHTPRAGPRRTSSSEKFDDGFDVGVLVHHPMFGSGKILDREGSGKRLKLTIRFAGSGQKKILPSYTRLEVRPS
jgi:DNA helicase-2/ATP-dependent DNA helicase PcrA